MSSIVQAPVCQLKTPKFLTGNCTRSICPISRQVQMDLLYTKITDLQDWNFATNSSSPTADHHQLYIYFIRLPTIIWFIAEEKRAHSVVELQRTSEAEPWGLVLLSGGGWGAGTACPRIAHLPPGSLAHRSDMLSQGDVLTSVNGISTRGMRVDDVTALVESAKTKLVLDVEYEIPPARKYLLNNTFTV